jgi:hypothetical protein
MLDVDLALFGWVWTWQPDDENLVKKKKRAAVFSSIGQNVSAVL